MSAGLEALNTQKIGRVERARPSTNGAVLHAAAEQTIRWQSGERLEHLFESRCDWLRQHGRGGHLAVDAGEWALTYDQLDARANQLARYLLAHGARAGDRIGLLFDQAVHCYTGMLAVLKINAIYVPLDVGFPPDRLSYIVRDAGARTVVSLSHLRHRLEDVEATCLCVDEVELFIATEDDQRLTDAEKERPVDGLCYIIYTSGSTGRPKGVAIEHASVCNFVRVAGEVYGIQQSDRVYQGMTIAFDFSVEEIWVPLALGATLVPKPGGSSLIGPELREFLQANGVTALCCVPTLLATLDEDLPDLRFLLVSGEACPHDLIARWHRPGRRFLNVYGPTEATVTATWTAVDPARPVTIGVPLPTYSVVILDPTETEALPHGAIGEIGIAGIGLARGYLNRDDLTERAFIPDFLGIENNPSGKIYRTGDLGRINGEGEIEYHGRIDTQVKIRGYRIELSEIESVLSHVPGIAHTVVGTYEPEPGAVELVAYYTVRGNTGGVDPEQVYQHLRGRLPGYMVPAYFEELDAIPMLPSDKADRKKLPAPKNPRGLATQQSYVGPTTDTERALAEVLADLLRLDRVSIDSDFFDDLGANSLLLARFCTAIRKRPELPSVSIKEVYLHPTIGSLAGALSDAVPRSLARVPPPNQAVARVNTAQYVLCGALQCLIFLGYVYLAAALASDGSSWILAGTGWLDRYLRILAVGAAGFAGICALPILAKWVLIGRWRPTEIRIWSLAYVRFWTVKTLVRSNPLVLFAGSPLYVLYLRALGARVGRGVAIFSRNVPVCTDLLTIGDGTVIRKDSWFLCYRATAGLIQTGTVTLGKDVFVGEQTVVDIETSLGDGSQLGHSSSLHPGQAVPDGQHWHGSPAQRTDVNYRGVEPTRCGTLRKVVYSVLQLLTVLVLYLPVIMVAVGAFTAILSSAPVALTNWAFYREALAVSFVLFFGLMAAGLIFVVTVPRLLNIAFTPDRVYPLYGFHYSVHRTIARITNTRFFMRLFGDSSYIVYFLRRLGYDLSQVQQTGSNFGNQQKHETPYLSTVGTGTMISDGLSMINADFSSTSFRVSRVSIGERNFLGNNITYPPGARVGENCLLATKAMVPIDGEVRNGVGLLGSPCFEIPRSTQCHSRFDRMKTGDELRRRLAAKNKYNAVTIGVFLLARWFRVLVIALLIWLTDHLFGWLPHGLDNRFDALGTAVVPILALVVAVSYSVLVERAVAGFRPLRPQFRSIYEPYYWWHERLWKLEALPLFNGTPFKNVLWRLLGVRLGRRVFDDGCYIPEKTLVTIGDDSTLNTGTVIQCHSQEDGIFKSDYTTIGAGCTLGTKAFVHYGVTMGDGSVLAPDSFLMKGEEVPPGSSWWGNPATERSRMSPAGAEANRGLLSSRVPGSQPSTDPTTMDA
jgi:non-ribosomal peptide synthetase-like protein